jgi:hypothetical protein
MVLPLLAAWGTLRQGELSVNHPSGDTKREPPLAERLPGTGGGVPGTDAMSVPSDEGRPDTRDDVIGTLLGAASVPNGTQVPSPWDFCRALNPPGS